ncbi:MAG TPA: glycine cleavage T C-terminal barrel domain-containing protein [Chthoniobacterales bacterium]|jgi:folate-binding protein YgfZ
MAARFRDLSSEVRLRVTGSDRVRFLNGQTTNDVRKANETSAQESCVLNAKGHLDAHLFLFVSSDAIWVSADAELRSTLRERLERYLIADDVAIEDITDDFALIHTLSEKQPQVFESQFCVRSHRLLSDGWDIWIPAEKKGEALLALAAAYEPVSETEWETLRVEEGVPAWGRELTPEIIPPEANLAERAIDYAKGCYIGQETISRMKMSGQVRQRLCGVLGEGNGQFTRGMDLCAGEKVVGRITSAVFSDRLDAPIALAMVKRGFNEIGTNLSARSNGPPMNVRISPLPFVTPKKI